MKVALSAPPDSDVVVLANHAALFLGVAPDARVDRGPADALGLCYFVDRAIEQKGEPGSPLQPTEAVHDFAIQRKQVGSLALKARRAKYRSVEPRHRVAAATNGVHRFEASIQGANPPEPNGVIIAVSIEHRNPPLRALSRRLRMCHRQHRAMTRSSSRNQPVRLVPETVRGLAESDTCALYCLPKRTGTKVLHFYVQLAHKAGAGSSCLGRIGPLAN